MVEAQLNLGHGVVIPQYLGRTDFIVRLEAAARRCGAGFIEVVLQCDRAVATERLR